MNGYNDILPLKSEVLSVCVCVCIPQMKRIVDNAALTNVYTHVQ